MCACAGFGRDPGASRAVFAAIGRDPQPVLGLASRAWRHATNTGRLETEVVDESAVVIRVSDFLLTEAVAVGIAEGVLEACGRQGVVARRMRTPTAGDFWVHWR